MNKIDKKEMEAINNVIELDNIETKEIKTRKPYTKKPKDLKETKVCKLCNIEKPLNEFVINQININRQPTLKNKCLLCYQEMSKKYYSENKDRVKQLVKDNYINNKKHYKVAIKFNTLEEFNKQLNIIMDKLKDNQWEDFKLKKKDKTDI
jgi:hypothetical protein